MDIETVLATCLMQNSPIRGKDLYLKLGEKGYKVSKSQFFRYCKRLVKAGKLARNNGIYYYRQAPQKKEPENFPLALSDFEKAGVTQIDVELRNTHPGLLSTVKGILLFRGAKKLQDTLNIHVPVIYDALFFSEAIFEINDVVSFQGTAYRVADVEPIYDVYSLKYRIAKLIGEAHQSLSWRRRYGNL